MWCTKTVRNKFKSIKKVAKSRQRPRHLIFNWFRAKGRTSAGVVEGLTSVVKLITRTAFGLRSAWYIGIGLLHVLGPIPEPNFTHRFF
jgi:transposase